MGGGLVYVKAVGSLGEYSWSKGWEWTFGDSRVEAGIDWFAGIRIAAVGEATMEVKLTLR